MLDDKDTLLEWAIFASFMSGMIESSADKDSSTD